MYGKILLNDVIAAFFIAAALSLRAAEYRLERRGDALEAFVDGRRFAVLSPAESPSWTLEHDAGGQNFIGFVFTPKPVGLDDLPVGSWEWKNVL